MAAKVKSKVKIDILGSLLNGELHATVAQQSEVASSVKEALKIVVTKNGSDPSRFRSRTPIRAISSSSSSSSASSGTTAPASPSPSPTPILSASGMAALSPYATFASLLTAPSSSSSMSSSSASGSVSLSPIPFSSLPTNIFPNSEFLPSLAGTDISEYAIEYAVLDMLSRTYADPRIQRICAAMVLFAMATGVSSLADSTSLKFWTVVNEDSLPEGTLDVAQNVLAQLTSEDMRQALIASLSGKVVLIGTNHHTGGNPWAGYILKVFNILFPDAPSNISVDKNHYYIALHALSTKFAYAMLGVWHTSIACDFIHENYDPQIDISAGSPSSQVLVSSDGSIISEFTDNKGVKWSGIGIEVLGKKVAVRFCYCKNGVVIACPMIGADLTLRLRISPAGTARAGLATAGFKIIRGHAAMSVMIKEHLTDFRKLGQDMIKIYKEPMCFHPSALWLKLIPDIIGEYDDLLADLKYMVPLIKANHKWLKSPIIHNLSSTSGPSLAVLATKMNAMIERTGGFVIPIDGLLDFEAAFDNFILIHGRPIGPDGKVLDDAVAKERYRQFIKDGIMPETDNKEKKKFERALKAGGKKKGMKSKGGRKKGSSSSHESDSESGSSEDTDTSSS